MDHIPDLEFFFLGVEDSFPLFAFSSPKNMKSYESEIIKERRIDEGRVKRERDKGTEGFMKQGRGGECVKERTDG